jgi:hypothetical protein
VVCEGGGDVWCVSGEVMLAVKRWYDGNVYDNDGW